MKTDAEPPKQQPGAQTHVIASPNPAVKESDAPADAPPVTSTKVEATKTTRQAPLKKPGESTTKPRN